MTLAPAAPPRYIAGMLSGFKTFALRGNLVDMAVGITVGAAFGTIAKSLVDDIIMPPVGLLLGGVDFSNLFLVLKQGAKAPPPYATLQQAVDSGAVVIKYGVFINTVVSFLIVAFAVYLIVSAVQRAKDRLERQQATDAVPPAPTPTELLLGEIRDLLRDPSRRA